MDKNRAAAEVTMKAARLQYAVSTSDELEIMDAIKRLAYALGEVIENTTGRKFAGLDTEKAVTLIANSSEEDEIGLVAA